MCSRLSLAYRLPHDLSPRRRCRALLPHCNIALSSTVCYSRRHCPTADDQSDHSLTTCLCLHRQRNISTQAEGHARTRRLGGRRRTETAAGHEILRHSIDARRAGNPCGQPREQRLLQDY
ncbi:hypothetical protein GW17_00048445 [Ensete ventricosum]|nr:hypothetical protein GW17_00048445 [Ensete ventricosum]RZS11615.1 hypothetical protein BHM03_00042968 [Ensete ventricosum]